MIKFDKAGYRTFELEGSKYTYATWEDEWAKRTSQTEILAFRLMGSTGKHYIPSEITGKDHAGVRPVKSGKIIAI